MCSSRAQLRRRCSSGRPICGWRDCGSAVLRCCLAGWGSCCLGPGGWAAGGCVACAAHCMHLLHLGAALQGARPGGQCISGSSWCNCCAGSCALASMHCIGSHTCIFTCICIRCCGGLLAPSPCAPVAVCFPRAVGTSQCPVLGFGGLSGPLHCPPHNILPGACSSDRRASLAFLSLSLGLPGSSCFPLFG